MKKAAMIFLSLVVVMFLATRVQAELVFDLDFGQDGIAEQKLDGVDYWELTPSEVVWIDVYVSNVPDPGLISFGIDIAYDPSQLGVTPGTETYMPNWYITSAADISTPGDIIMKGGRMFPGLAGDNIKLGTIELHCEAIGLSDIWLYDTDRCGGFDDFVLADGSGLDDEFCATGIKLGSVNNVPIPGSFLLLASALFGLVGIKRKSI